jgi:hypothetical protein
MAMAKKPTKSQADDAAAQTPPARSRPRAKREIGPETISAPRATPPARMQPPGEALAAVGDQRLAATAGHPTEDDIRRRAYQMYLERGGGHGMDFEDWLRAESELKARH